MTKAEALELLKNAPRDNKPSKVNPSLTRNISVRIIENGVMNRPEGDLPDIYEKRVWQVVKDQRRPRY
jgi:hypothetical protein